MSSPSSWWYVALALPAITTFTYSGISAWQPDTSPTYFPDESLVSWQSAFWALMPLAISAATMDNTLPPFAVDDLSPFLRVSPIFCAFDSLYKLLEARLLSPATGWVKLSTSPPPPTEQPAPPPLSRRLPRHILLVISLVQSLKVITSSDIPLTLLQALIFLSHIIWTLFLSSSPTLFPHTHPTTRTSYVETTTCLVPRATLSRVTFVTAGILFALQPQFYPFIAAYRYRGRVLVPVGVGLWHVEVFSPLLGVTVRFPPGGKVVFWALVASLDSLVFAARERNHKEGVQGIWNGSGEEKWSGTGGLVVLYACVPLLALAWGIVRFDARDGTRDERVRKGWWLFLGANLLSLLLVYQQCFDARGTRKPGWAGFLG